MDLLKVMLQNTTVATPANKILAVMINLSYGAPTFITRFMPVSCFTRSYFEVALHIRVFSIARDGNLLLH